MQAIRKHDFDHRYCFHSSFVMFFLQLDIIALCNETQTVRIIQLMSRTKGGRVSSTSALPIVMHLHSGKWKWSCQYVLSRLTSIATTFHCALELSSNVHTRWSFLLSLISACSSTAFRNCFLHHLFPHSWRQSRLSLTYSTNKMADLLTQEQKVCNFFQLHLSLSLPKDQERRYCPLGLCPF